jgi:hypothetical protein
MAIPLAWIDSSQSATHVWQFAQFTDLFDQFSGFSLAADDGKLAGAGR